MRFGRTGGASASVSAGTASKQYYDITWGGAFTAHVCSGRRCHNSAYFHAFGSVSVVVDLIDLTCGKTYLVTVA